MKSFAASLFALALTASFSSCSSSHYIFPAGTGAYGGSRSGASVASRSTISGPAQEAVSAADNGIIDVAEDPTAGATASVAAPSPARPLAGRRAGAPHGVALVSAPRPVAAAPRPAASAVVVAPQQDQPRLSRRAVRQVLRQQAKTAKAGTASGYSQLVAALLCFTAGPLGLHDFYLGYTGKGIVQILLSLVFVGYVLALVDLVRILRGTIKPKGADYEKKL